ncbi:MAG: methyltransferase domain-containing protein [Anaerolineae bacterium]|nr:methyltransferase domain-containing protein [Anaerolineae bacterium]
MTHDEMVSLIRGGVPAPGGTWADFGAGSGNFTRALRELVGESATIYAIDRDSAALRQQPSAVQTIQADFTQPLTLPPLDGLLIANALHWVRQQSRTLRLLANTLKPGGRFLIVEYDVTLPRGYIPFPVPYPHFEKLAESAGLHAVQRVGERRSPSSGVVMYAGLALN